MHSKDLSLKKKLYRVILQALQVQDVQLGQLACQAMKWRGYAEKPLHPKHLFDEKRSSLLHSLFKPGINFLDLGSGVGTDCILAKQKGAATVIGVEGRQENCENALLRAENAGVQIECVTYDLEQAALPVKNGFFNLVNFSNVLEHLDNRKAVLEDLKAKITADAAVVISIPNTDTTWKKTLRSVGLDSYDDAEHKIEYSRETLEEELSRAGFTIVSDLYPIIPGIPWNGLIAMSAAVSPKLYRKLQTAKRHYVERHPEESIGWVFLAR